MLLAGCSSPPGTPRRRGRARWSTPRWSTGSSRCGRRSGRCWPRTAGWTTGKATSSTATPRGTAPTAAPMEICGGRCRRGQVLRLRHPRPVLGEAPSIRRSPSARASSRRGAYQAAPAPRFSRTPAGLPEPLRDVHHLGSRAAGGVPADGAHRRADGVSNTPVREALLALCSWSCAAGPVQLVLCSWSCAAGPVQLVLCSWSCAAGPAQPVLRSEGLVELVPRRGFIVASFRRQDVRDQFWAQAQLARELAARAAKKIAAKKIAPKQIAKLEAIPQQYESARRQRRSGPHRGAGPRLSLADQSGLGLPPAGSAAQLRRPAAALRRPAAAEPLLRRHRVPR